MTARTQNEHDRGALIARLLSGSWREQPASPNLSEAELASITQRLCESGAAALAWWRIRNSVLAHTESGERLHNAYRQFRLSAAKHEREIKRVLPPLRAAGIEPVLVKGWAAVRRYPDRGLRAYGDVDLCVAPEQFTEAARVLKSLESGEGHHVDLHAGFDRIGCGEAEQTIHRFHRFHRLAGKKRVPPQRGTKRSMESTPASGDSHSSAEQTSYLRNLCNLRTDSWHEIFNRSQLFGLDEVKVRVLCPEDHLRILALHFLRSGALRPHGVCDIALILEQQKEEFDWECCLGSDPLYANWIACAVGLARELLGAEVKGQRSEVRGRRSEVRDQRSEIRGQRSAVRGQMSVGGSPIPDLFPLTSDFCPPASVPRWLAPAVLRQWGRPREHYAAQIALRPSSPVNFFSRCAGLYARWENPVRATARVNGRFDDRPRLPYQLLESILRLPEVFAD
jgi:hypothetical protein